MRGCGSGKSSRSNAVISTCPHADSPLSVPTGRDTSRCRKAAGHAQLPLTQRLTAALKSVRHLPGERVSCRPDGSPIARGRVIKAVRRAQRVAGIEQGVHILRHTFCSHLAMKGAPARGSQELAGHADLSTTQRYLHLRPAATEDGIRLLDGRQSGVVCAESFGDILDTREATK